MAGRTAAIAELLREASRVGTSLARQQELMTEVERLRTEAAQEQEATTGYQVTGARIRDTLVPAPAYQFNSTDTDWLLSLPASTASVQSAHTAMIAEATLWFGRVGDDVKTHPEEFGEQARNKAHRVASVYGPDDAPGAERTFLDEAARLHRLAVTAGLSLATQASFDPEDDELLFFDKQAASGLPQVGETTIPDDTFSALNGGGELPAAATSSNRAPALQELGEQTPPGGSVIDGHNPSAVTDNAGDVGVEDYARAQQGFPVGASIDSHTETESLRTRSSVHNTKESHMAEAQCPTCAGHGRVAVRDLDPREAYSQLPQIDQIVNADDSPGATALPEQVAWPIQPGWGQGANTIAQTEQQIAERNARSPLLSGTAAQRTAMDGMQPGGLNSGRDNSGWIGDNGARGTDYPGYSTPNYGGPSNLGQPDPVYGEGGDNPNQPLKPYGAGEAGDYTNNPGQNWQHGQPTQADQAWRTVAPNGGMSTQGGFHPDPYIASAQVEIRRQQDLIAQRNAALAGTR